MLRAGLDTGWLILRRCRRIILEARLQPGSRNLIGRVSIHTAAAPHSNTTQR